jgi:UDP-3-O-acyl-N-acetylglucosamine deacetylase
MADRTVPRRTLVQPVELSGRGLFTGQSAALRIAPAESGSGIRFHCADRGGAEIPAFIEHVAPAPQGMPPRNTTLRNGDASVMTVEHLLSALAGIGIADAAIEIRGPEVPMFDGSSLKFVESILRVGFRTLPLAEASPLIVKYPLGVRAGEATITAQPRIRPGALYRYELEYGPSAPISTQQAEIEIIPFEETLPDGYGSFRDYCTQIAPARTFCLAEEAKQMAAAGLFQHLTPRDMLVIGAGGPIDNALRFANEPARHKLLDLIGDLALVGRPIEGEIIASRSGHALNHAMARALLEAFA